MNLELEHEREVLRLVIGAFIERLRPFADRAFGFLHDEVEAIAARCETTEEMRRAPVERLLQLQADVAQLSADEIIKSAGLVE